jgi:hypothetical protein
MGAAGSIETANSDSARRTNDAAFDLHPGDCAQNPRMSSPNDPPAQARNPLHGLTLEAIVTALVAHYGWEELGRRIPLRCFTHEPSINSSLRLLRKTPWAREKVEGLYLFMLREQRRARPPAAG